MSKEALLSQTVKSQRETIQAYYRRHAGIYKLSRWSFLFGRKRLIKKIAKVNPQASNILEVGCGIGTNLSYLAHYFPSASIVGLDLSADMIAESAKAVGHLPNIKLVQSSFLEEQTLHERPWDIIVFSYALTMINPQWIDCMEHAKALLGRGGNIAIVDFHDSQFQFFKNHMGNNHVRMDGHIIDKAKQLFEPTELNIHAAYAGLWQYALFIGRKPIK